MNKRINYATLYKQRVKEKDRAEGQCKNCCYYTRVNWCNKYKMITLPVQTCKSFGVNNGGL